MEEVSPPGENVEINISVETSYLFIPMTGNFHRWEIAVPLFFQSNIPLKNSFGLRKWVFFSSKNTCQLIQGIYLKLGWIG